MPLSWVLPFVPASSIATHLPHHKLPGQVRLTDRYLRGSCKRFHFPWCWFHTFAFSLAVFTHSSNFKSFPLRVSLLLTGASPLLYPSTIPLHTILVWGQHLLVCMSLLLGVSQGQGHVYSMVPSGVAVWWEADWGRIPKLTSWVTLDMLPLCTFTVCFSKCKLVLMIPSEQNFAKTK